MMFFLHVHRSAMCQKWRALHWCPSSGTSITISAGPALEATLLPARWRTEALLLIMPEWHNVSGCPRLSIVDQTGCRNLCGCC